jgi:hypothetical protein
MYASKVIIIRIINRLYHISDLTLFYETIIQTPRNPNTSPPIYIKFGFSLSNTITKIV